MLIQVGCVPIPISRGPQQPHLLGAPQNQPDRASRCEACLLDEFQCCHGDAHTSPVIDCARAQIPAVKMSADYHDFLGALPTHHLGNNVPGLRGGHYRAVHPDPHLKHLSFGSNAFNLVSIRI